MTRMLILFLLTGCGAAPSNDQQDAPKEDKPSTATTGISVMSYAVTSAAELPPCDTSHEKQLFYIMETQEFRTCQGGSWVAINIQGPKGEDGKDGETGPAGKDGQDGAVGPAGPAGEDAAAEVDTITLQEAILAFQTIQADMDVADLSPSALAILGDKDTALVNNPNHCPGQATQEYRRTQGGYAFFVRIFKSIVDQASIFQGTTEIHYSASAIDYCP